MLRATTQCAAVCMCHKLLGCWIHTMVVSLWPFQTRCSQHSCEQRHNVSAKQAAETSRVCHCSTKQILYWCK